MLDSPPTSDVFSDDMDSSSIRDKTLLSKSVPRHNNNNFKTGTESIELIPDSDAIKLFGDIDLDHIYKRDGRLEGYEGESVTVTSEDSSIILNLEGYSRPGRATMKLKIAKNETIFRGLNLFEVKNENDRAIFTVSEPVFASLKNGRNFKAKRIQTNKIRSPNDEDLKIDSEKINLKGAEGTKMEGREVVWSAEEDIYLSSNGSIALSGQDGTFIDVRRIPLANTNGNTYATAQFKVCVCMPGGKLFRIPVIDPQDRVYCHHVNMQHNFCL
ncbi:hypothetical protein NQ318_010344 [Aromia moschata]|uniref:Beta-sarcoglycan n=1 Tax=Aromia moschata TaxID=1265417 RepID=A0AAV8YGA9_9CUCU|nr:hypothetical protein NQ318_010344 [Aromia moschata]